MSGNAHRVPPPHPLFEARCLPPDLGRADASPEGQARVAAYRPGVNPCPWKTSARQDRLDGRNDLVGFGLGHRPEPADDVAAGRNQELLEVPLDVARLALLVRRRGE